MELLVGAGTNRDKRMQPEGYPKEWAQLVTLDIDPAVKPDFVHDLNSLPYPFTDDLFDEVHAYDVLEHTGQQGDWRFFFNQWQEFWRIMKPDAIFCGCVPAWDSIWATGDPGHTRVISEASLVFLNQEEYALQVGRSAMTDYRGAWSGNFKLLGGQYELDSYAFVLQAIK